MSSGLSLPIATDAYVKHPKAMVTFSLIEMCSRRTGKNSSVIGHLHSGDTNFCPETEN